MDRGESWELRFELRSHSVLFRMKNETDSETEKVFLA